MSHQDENCLELLLCYFEDYIQRSLIFMAGVICMLIVILGYMLKLMIDKDDASSNSGSDPTRHPSSSTPRLLNPKVFTKGKKPKDSKLPCGVGVTQEASVRCKDLKPSKSSKQKKDCKPQEKPFSCETVFPSKDSIEVTRMKKDLTSPLSPQKLSVCMSNTPSECSVQCPTSQKDCNPPKKKPSKINWKIFLNKAKDKTTSECLHEESSFTCVKGQKEPTCPLGSAQQEPFPCYKPRPCAKEPTCPLASDQQQEQPPPCSKPRPSCPLASAQQQEQPPPCSKPRPTCPLASAQQQEQPPPCSKPRPTCPLASAQQQEQPSPCSNPRPTCPLASVQQQQPFQCSHPHPDSKGPTCNLTSVQQQPFPSSKPCPIAKEPTCPLSSAQQQQQFSGSNPRPDFKDPTCNVASAQPQPFPSFKPLPVAKEPTRPSARSDQQQETLSGSKPRLDFKDPTSNTTSAQRHPFLRFIPRPDSEQPQEQPLQSPKPPAHCSESTCPYQNNISQQKKPQHHFYPSSTQFIEKHVTSTLSLDNPEKNPCHCDSYSSDTQQSGLCDLPVASFPPTSESCLAIGCCGSESSKCPCNKGPKSM